MPKKLIPMAIAYDFDGTLAPGNMQEYDFIPALHMLSKQFWDAVNEFAVRHEADPILAYMYTMLEEARKAKVAVRKSDFKNYGAKIAFIPGVQDWFDRINAYAKGRGVRLQHYIISSGLREMVEGTAIYKKFRKVYASGFMFDPCLSGCHPHFTRCCVGAYARPTTGGAGGRQPDRHGLIITKWLVGLRSA